MTRKTFTTPLNSSNPNNYILKGGTQGFPRHEVSDKQEVLFEDVSPSTAFSIHQRIRWRIENAVDGETSSNKTSCLSLTSCLGNRCVPPFKISQREWAQKSLSPSSKPNKYVKFIFRLSSPLWVVFVPCSSFLSASLELLLKRILLYLRSCVPFSARQVVNDCSFLVVGPVGQLHSPGRTFRQNARSRLR